MRIFVKKSAICILFNYLIYFLGLLGGGGGGTNESPFTPHKWAKEKIPLVWQGGH
jgi:hypothetical protein